MFYIAESSEQLEVLSRYEEGFLEVIQGNDLYHPKLTSVVAIYLRPLLATKGFIIPIAHSEGLNVTLQQVQDVISKYKTLYVLDKKFTLYHLAHPNIQDLHLAHSLTTFSELILPHDPKIFNQIYHKYARAKTINSVIPLCWLYQRGEDRWQVAQTILSTCSSAFDEPSWKFYNNVATGVFSLVERSGLRVLTKAFVDLYKPRNPVFNIDNNIVYGYYNLYNNTSRPTNSFNSINFAAIPKKKEYREAIVPTNNRFVEMDFDGYHVRLLADIVGHELSSESVHTQLGREYFNTQQLTQEQYEESKKITFQQLYGGVEEKYRYIDFFDKVAQLKNKLWKDFVDKGFAEAPISRKKFTKELKDMHALKLMNYIVQNLETSRNIVILYKALQYLKDKHTKIALYTYDAILFDVSDKDGDILPELMQILSEQGKYPVKLKQSNSLFL